MLIDYVVNDLNAKIEVDKTLSIDAKASLATAIANLGKDTSAGVTVTNNNDGTFTVSAKHIVVASVLGPPDASITQAAGPADTGSALGSKTVDASLMQSLRMRQLQKAGQFQ